MSSTSTDYIPPYLKTFTQTGDIAPWLLSAGPQITLLEYWLRTILQNTISLRDILQYQAASEGTPMFKDVLHASRLVDVADYMRKHEVAVPLPAKDKLRHINQDREKILHYLGHQVRPEGLAGRALLAVVFERQEETLRDTKEALAILDALPQTVRTHTIVLSAQSHQKHRNNSLTNTSIDRLKAPLLKIFSPSAPESGLNPLVSGSTDQTLPEHWQRVALGTTQILKQKLRNSILSDIGPDPETSLLMPFARYVKAEKSSVPLTVKDDLRRITADRERIVEYLKTQVPPRIKEHRISLVLIIGQQEELLEDAKDAMEILEELPLTMKDIELL